MSRTYERLNAPSENEDDVYLENDVSNIGRKRYKTKEEGYYDSDSEEEVAMKKTKNDDDASDMFSESSGDEEKGNAGKRTEEEDPSERLAQKGLSSRNELDDEFEEDDAEAEEKLSYEDIEGQEEAPDAQDSGSSEEEMTSGNPKVIPFNLKEDMEEGDFDENGNFVRKSNDPSDQYDAWLNGDVCSKRSIAAAKRAELTRKQQAHQKMLSDIEESKRLPFQTVPEALSFLIIRMEPDENVLSFLQRQSVSNSAASRSKKHKKPSEHFSPERRSADEYRKRLIEIITGCITFLEDRTKFESLYSETKEALQRLFQRITHEAWRPPAVDMEKPLFYFKWEGDEKVYGPYSGSQMQAWDHLGYFTNAKQAAFVSTSADGNWMFPQNVSYLSENST
ncbi:GYF domain-containing protein [Schizosaccharomyces cryophilus OY26]|uniref:GYF domain-containing protein n=1 Tax=Schizosaccharomyces cryophilus (strain OY26 / ATCC MYA-4695 / CBS 11777 / NBRC 106824 / NRRL Y48691) TaxID=653667 RepID=S9VSN9_SCHCR|nr:GYF domain-containing protein [Schizosaccharomyces cryophilus OY26]EPY49199.1 GYF domain-containing protein [Schizosaccharomyces cryophilus OY26]